MLLSNVPVSVLNLKNNLPISIAQGWEKLYCNAFFISQNNNIVLQCMLSSNQLLLPGGLMQSIIAMF